ncbi:MAG: winged helix-turn-helix domain-containing protein [Alphaproteobacteria bacterium]
MNTDLNIVIFSPNIYLEQIFKDHYSNIYIATSNDLNHLELMLKNNFYNLYIIDYFQEFNYSNFWHNKKELYEQYINFLIFLFPLQLKISIPKFIQYLRKPICLNNLFNLTNNLLEKSQHHFRINEIFSFYPYSRILIKNNGSNYEKLNLTEKEASIINLLYKKNTLLTKEEMLETVWGYSNFCNTHTVETHMYRLRKKLGTDNPLILSSDNGYILNLKPKN